ncbi:hypothetical protein JD844_005118 [Phrynosoma platyrhinos]|uniref:Lipocalin/cytosolic fatty-acid binding domain-containing protein n=1 Tax=Phrynosoma platyrhinos TaxID=52577 RepID=A0ABQ7SEA2_PHRPL|nr:hypothetical protein JD844_005118 [Phrynosoma platyrhinos]
MNGVALRQVASLLLLSGLGFLCIEAEIPVQPNFDLKKFAGQWHPIQATQDRGEHFEVTARPPSLEASADSRLTWTVDIPVKGTKCKKQKFYRRQLDKPGIYKGKGEAIYRIVETDYTTYFIFHKENPDFNVLSLYAREKEASNEAKEKFNSVAKSLGFPVEKTIPITLPVDDPDVWKEDQNRLLGMEETNLTNSTDYIIASPFDLDGNKSRHDPKMTSMFFLQQQ